MSTLTGETLGMLSRAGELVPWSEQKDVFVLHLELFEQSKAHEESIPVGLPTSKP